METGGRRGCPCNLARFLVGFLEEPLVPHLLGVLGRENFLYAQVFIISSFVGYMWFGLVSRVGVLTVFWLFCLFNQSGTAASKSFFTTLCKQTISLVLVTAAR